jgi:hypothetical protein
VKGKEQNRWKRIDSENGTFFGHLGNRSRKWWGIQ